MRTWGTAYWDRLPPHRVQFHLDSNPPEIAHSPLRERVGVRVISLIPTIMRLTCHPVTAMIHIGHPGSGLTLSGNWQRCLQNDLSIRSRDGPCGLNGFREQ